MSFSFHNPVAVRFGRGCASALAGSTDSATPAASAAAASSSAVSLAAALPKPALLVAGRATLQRTGLDALVDDKTIFACPGVPPNPTPAVIDAGAARAVELGVATIVGIGGGSAQDAAKSMAVMVGQATSIRDFQARCKTGEEFTRQVKLFQVPTTAGTGSEVTRWASVWSEAGAKSSMDHASGYADEAWVDPAFTDGMNARLTAATGLDAMGHAMESLWGVHHNPVSDAHATAALSLVRRHLLPCVQADGAPDIADHRDAMALAALHAGLALSNTRTAAAHALSYSMTGDHGLDHGLAVGLLCRGLLPVNAAVVPERVEHLLNALGVDSVQGAQAFIDTIFRAAGMSPSLQSFGISAAAHGAIVDTAAGADRLANNPGTLDGPALTAILESIA